MTKEEIRKRQEALIEFAQPIRSKARLTFTSDAVQVRHTPNAIYLAPRVQDTGDLNHTYVALPPEPETVRKVARALDPEVYDALETILENLAVYSGIPEIDIAIASAQEALA